MARHGVGGSTRSALAWPVTQFKRHALERAKELLRVIELPDVEGAFRTLLRLGARLETRTEDKVRADERAADYGLLDGGSGGARRLAFIVDGLDEAWPAPSSEISIPELLWRCRSDFPPWLVMWACYASLALCDGRKSPPTPAPRAMAVAGCCRAAHWPSPASPRSWFLRAPSSTSTQPPRARLTSRPASLLLDVAAGRCLMPLAVAQP